MAAGGRPAGCRWSLGVDHVGGLGGQVGLGWVGDAGGAVGVGGVQGLGPQQRLDEGVEQARETLRANRHRLDALVEALLRTETLDAADAYRAAGVPRPAEPGLPAEPADVVRR